MIGLAKSEMDLSYVDGHGFSISSTRIADVPLASLWILVPSSDRNSGESSVGGVPLVDIAHSFVGFSSKSITQ